MDGRERQATLTMQLGGELLVQRKAHFVQLRRRAGAPVAREEAAALARRRRRHAVPLHNYGLHAALREVVRGGRAVEAGAGDDDALRAGGH